MEFEIHYLYDDETQLIYHTEGKGEPIPEDRPGLIYVGSSINPDKKQAVAFLMRIGKVKAGYSLRPLN